MSLKQYAIDSVIMFSVILVVNVLVTFLYSLIVHGAGAVEWGSAFTFAISLGIVLPWVRQREKKQR